MKLAPVFVASLAALVSFAAEAADVTGDWTATVATASESSEYTFTFRQVGSKIFGTIRSPYGVVAIANGYVNYRTITFDENVTAQGRRAVFEYTGEIATDTQLRFKRRMLGAQSGVVEFVATRVGPP